MGNLLCSHYAIHQRFDLKGSSQGRMTDKPIDQIDEHTTLKDLDLNLIFRLGGFRFQTSAGKWTEIVSCWSKRGSWITVFWAAFTSKIDVTNHTPQESSSRDLSSNQFTGSIPGTIGSSKLHTVLLNSNQLDGQVPEVLYSVGVHGGVIDLSGNKGLCGVPTLPACALFWEKGGLNKTGKIALGASFGLLLLVILIVVYIVCIRRGPYDYDFEFPQDLTSISAISAKRNRYQRAKSVMLAEIEAHSTDGFYTNGSTH